MNSYLLIVFADVMLAVNFVLTKKYQQKNGVSTYAGLLYNAFAGLFSAIVFFAVCGFKINFLPYSLLMATAMTTLCFIYTMIGFHILKHGNMSLYSMFLMGGGMVVPYIWGILFLNEELTLFRLLGIILIIIAIFIPGMGGEKINKKQILLCIAVFFINGFVSVISKLHQINTVFEKVDSSEFVFWTAIIKFLMCFAVMAFMKKESRKGEEKSIKVMPIICLSSLVSGISYLAQLIGAVNVSASVLYPLVTGGTVMLSAIAGLIAFGEKIDTRQGIGIAICFAGTLLFL